MMNEPASDELERRILLLTPTARDAAASREVLEANGLGVHICGNLGEVCREAERGAGALLLTEEALSLDGEGAVRRLLGGQPPWSDLPLIVLIPSGREHPRTVRVLEEFANVTLVKRPVELSVFVSTVKAALRDRLRQYELRSRLAALRLSEERYRTLFRTMDEGFSVIEVLFDGAGEPTDYRLLEVNPAFERLTGLSDAVGRRIREFAPDHEAHWFETYGRVARTGEPVRFENEARELDGRWYDLYAFRIGEPGECKVAVLFTDITERKELERSLRHRVRDLAEADLRKNEFLAMLAHELRNPLAGITSAIRLARKPGLEGRIPDAHEVIERQARNLARLIDDLLDVSRITQGKVELKREVVDVPSIITRAVEAVGPLVERKRHELTVQLSGGTMHADADPTRLEQIVGNLLTNAAKYSEEGGTIAVSARERDGQVVIAVKDAGVGISPEMLPRVFDLFTQVDRTVARSEGGLGIGLTLVKQLVEMHGGTIEATSEPGVGSEFTVRLPLVAKAPVGPTPGDDRVASGRGKRVLIVDDNADTARLTGEVLKLMGFAVDLVHDGRASLEAARRYRPEVVLLDIGLPGLNGFEVARQLRREEWGRDTLIVGVSGYGDAEAREQGREAGFDHHLVKPVDIEVLLPLIGHQADRG